MSFRWHVGFWVAALAIFIFLLWLLHEILLPFVAGMTLAYLLDPVARRLQRAGVNRLIATLWIVGLFVIALLVLFILFVPILGAQLTAFIENLPGFIER